ncbi:MAG: glucose-1-phosphate adenylyltransferase [Planctomycetes bacterium]|nr:glucose-1-phosphate adenylyltransferase [Planctomycetota bacterium]NBY03567.1 glucose-1-phosphate adenylyltransferase [Planctomycetota bacterium]
MKDVISLILGGGRGTRLYPLTQLRSKPAVPIGGKYRLIDIPISNCINSGFNRIYVLTQFLSVSLHRHIANSYKFDPFGQGFVEVLAAQQTNEGQNWYQGTADAVRQQIRYVVEDQAKEVMILSGDQLYRMDFRELHKFHQETKADVTIAVLPVSQEQVSGFGVVQVDETSKVHAFTEKPKTIEEIEPYAVSSDWLARSGIHAKNRPYLASMGIYLFNRKALLDLLNSRPLATDFGKEIFPRSIKNYNVKAFLFDGYWEDLGTIKAYHEANLALATQTPPFDFHSPNGVIYTRMRFLPASRFHGATLSNTLVSDGCVIEEGSNLNNCVIGVRSRIGKNVTLKESVIIGADRFESDKERSDNLAKGIPNLNVGDNSVIHCAILDKDCRVGRNVKLINARKIQHDEGNNFVIRDGIICVPRGSIIPDGTII